jgi:hypothetical protein
MNNWSANWFKKALPLVILSSVMGCATFFTNENVNIKTALGKSIAFHENKAYQAECTSCHVGFLAGFLPERSWAKLMGDLENHFGENAALDDGPRNEILAFLKKNSADAPGSTRRSHKIASLIKTSDTPIRITESLFWTRKHSTIKGSVWKRSKIGTKSKCEACHRDASKGIFDEHDVHVPKS